MVFVRIFSTEAQANAFAAMKGAKVTIRYDWDSYRMVIIKEFIVTY